MNAKLGFAGAAVCAVLAAFAPASAQERAAPAMDHSHHSMAPADGDDTPMAHQMMGVYGPYVASREASGTAWQPDSTPHEGLHFSAGEWSLMAHANLFGVYDRQGGPRGGDKGFAAGMIMGMAQRTLGEGTLGVRAMMSPDPLMGKRGYPLLFGTGETADGRTPLTDRQHPHDLLVELSTSYSRPLSDTSSAFVYLGLPGEPALGPPAFMHRFSGADSPEAPLSHHWLDSTHITYGVVTLGYVTGRWKIEGSAFRGREPDQFRYDVESPKLDSFAGRLSWNPTPNLSLQVSSGRINSPEQLSPNKDEQRTTASAIYNLPFGEHNWATTLAWGRKDERPGGTFDPVLLESGVTFNDTHTVFGRAERAEEHDLFEEPSPLQGRTFTINKLSLGYIYDFHLAEHAKLGLGGLVSKYVYPAALDADYGRDPTSFMLFVRLKVL